MSKKTLLHYATPAIITGMLFAAVAVSWDEPGSNPPAGNISAPINIGTDGQYKEGKLNIGNVQVPDGTFAELEVRGGGGFRTVGGAVLNTGGAIDGLIVANGNVGIGMAAPQELFHVQGNPSPIVSPTSYSGEVLFESDLMTVRDSSPTVKFKTTMFGGVENLNFGISSYSDDKLHFFSIKDDGTGKSSRLVINGNNGNVGIGIADPQAQLHLEGDSGDAAEVILKHTGPAGASAGITLNVVSDPTDFIIKAHDNRLKIGVKEVPANRMVIKSNGNVGIRTADPDTFLHVFGAAPEYEILIDSPASSAYGMISNGDTKRIVSLNDAVFGNNFWIEDSDVGGGSRYKIISAKQVGAKYNVGIGDIANPSQRLEVKGGVKLNTTDARPVCNTAARGTFWFTRGAVGVKDSVTVCAKDAEDAYDWRTIY